MTQYAWRSCPEAFMSILVGFLMVMCLQQMAQLSEHRFITAMAKDSGSTNGIIAWQDMKLYQCIEIDKQLLPQKYFFGNEALTNTTPFLSPWPGMSYFEFDAFVLFCFVL